MSASFKIIPAVVIGSAVVSSAGGTNALSILSSAETSASTTLSLFRVLGALALVLAIFFGGIWCLGNWQRVSGARGRLTKLSVCEARSLGHRQTLFVIGYEEQRLLVAASPTGVSLIASLPPAVCESQSTPAKGIPRELPLNGFLARSLAHKRR